MEKDVRASYEKAGAIAGKVRDHAASMVKPGVKLLDVAEKAEEMIRELGGNVAFPINISLNDIAAHYTPSINDKLEFSETDIVKIDVGVHVDGYIGDTAMTVCLDKECESMAKAAKDALEAALKISTPGTRIRDLGTAIQQTIEEAGFRPISNLTGHGLDKYNIHANPSIPNISNASKGELHDGQVIAIEPFATNGSGAIKEGGFVEIYAFNQETPVRLPSARKILKMSQNTFNGMPFAARWVKGIPQTLLEASLRRLIERGTIATFPILREVAEGNVTQAEHTVIVGDKPTITTRTDKF